MADDRKRHIKILIASPGDVSKERKIAEDVIKQWNIQHGDHAKLWLEAVLWESHGIPELGDRVQEILNRQIVDQCEAAIGIFWTRIGTDTGVAQAGAVEEIERLRRMDKPVMVYFSNVPIQLNPSELASDNLRDQAQRLRDYKLSLQSQGLVWEYETLEKFGAELSNHLALQASKWSRSTIESDEAIEAPHRKTPEADLLRRYQACIVAELDHVLPPAVQSFSAKVSDVFVSLRLSGAENFADKDCYSPEKALTTIFEKKERLLLVIGDPGSGKTTLLQHYALSCLDKKLCKKFGCDEPVMVFYLPLRELKKVKSSTVPLPLPANIFAWSEEHSLDIPEQFFSESLHQRKALVLLDGLDEISRLAERKSVCEWIRKSVNSFTQAYFVVTSRPTGYRAVDKIEIKPPVLRADILDFNLEQQKTFLYQWFKAVSPCKNNHQENAIEQADALLALLAKEQNKSLRQMAGIPVLLQIMALLWKRHDTLSSNRAVLYENALEYLLDYQYELKKIQPLLSVAYSLNVLAPVSLWMQETLQSDEAEKSRMEKQVQRVLQKVVPDENAPTGKDFCNDMVDRAGLLVEHGKREYIFRHKSFREYLVAVQLLTATNKTAPVQKLINHFNKRWWEEPIHYFFQQIDEKSFDFFMRHFFNSTVSDALTPERQILLQTLIEEAPEKKVDALCNKLLDHDTTPNRQRLILDCLKAINKPEALVALLEFRGKNLAKESKDIAGRAEELIIAFGGKALDRAVGQSVSGKPASYRNPNEENAEYILIPGGNYWYSAMQKTVDVADCYVAKYPLTNKLYRSFIGRLGGKDSGKNDVSAFRAALERIAQGNEWGPGFGDYLKGNSDLADLFRSNYDEDRKFGGENQPVVGVTWYAAQAYCLWLSMLEGKTACYRLAYEIEWEWAAGGKQGTTGQKVREYPWPEEKGEASSVLMNYNNNEGATTPVGSYPDGATPEGLYDMAGNVWEWCSDWYGDDGTFADLLGPETGSARVLRGGSWYDDAEFCRSAYRNDYPPYLRLNYIGFRLVFVP